MNKKAIPFCLLRCAAVLTLLTGTLYAHPNVLLIAVDDLNDWVGCMRGHPQAQTPNIDRLCAEGIRFTQAYTSTAICSPARATAAAQSASLTSTG